MARSPRELDVRSWEGMRTRIARLLEERTGESVEAWRERLAGSGAADEAGLRRWLAEQGVTGYPQQLLVWERFGYPDFVSHGADELIEGQYADRAHLRPVLEAILAVLPEIGDVALQARKGYLSLVTPRRTFAVVQATTKERVDLGLRLAGEHPGGRLEPGGSVGNGSMTVRVPLSSAEAVDAEVVALLGRAYAENS